MLDASPLIKEQLASGEIRAFTLIHMAIDGVDHRFTDCDVPIALNGDLYEPRGYKLGTVSYSLAKIVDSARFSIDNLDDRLTASFIGGNPQGSPATVYLVALDESYKLLGSAPDNNLILFTGEIDDWFAPEGAIEITIVSDLIRWHQKTMRMQSSSCSWQVFKGLECGYAGTETTCNRSYARCIALGNTANFGGERWLPSIEGANIWWGQTPEVSK